MIEFVKWPKTPRLFRDIVITEKLDGTNSAIHIQPASGTDPEKVLAYVDEYETTYEVAAQSRNRLIFPGKTTDNHGFAAFVQHNAEALFELLGEGTHFGEWWGSGIQGRYTNLNGLGIKRFALFNTAKYKGLREWLVTPDGRRVLLETTPVLYEGPFEEAAISKVLTELEAHGSTASPGDPAEGICIYHTQSGQVYKVTLDNQDKGKWELI